MTDIVRIAPHIPAGQHWKVLEPIFTECRRRLSKDPSWRYGPPRVKEVAWQAFSRLTPYAEIQGKSYVDLGCGPEHPFGTSAIMFLNGARACQSIDKDRTDAARAAEALADLLVDCLIRPSDWLWSGTTREDFLERLTKFDLASLKDGQLQPGLAGVPLEFRQVDFTFQGMASDSLDMMSSRAVLEHIMDFQEGLTRIYEMMTSGGVAFHLVDLVDHRIYGDPDNFHYWSFLSEDEDWTGGSTNRLRAHEMDVVFRRTGFEVLDFKPGRSPMPPDFRSQIKGRFKYMTDEELEITSGEWVLRKP